MVKTLSNSGQDKSDDLAIANIDEAFLARACKAASDPIRLKILRVLRAESFGVLELCHILDMAQSKLSHHLKVLANAGLVATRREGNSIYYRRPLLASENPLAEFTRALFNSIDEIAIEAKLAQHIKKVRAERAQSSLEFFAKNSEKFKENQALITENSQYVANIRELVKLASLPDGAVAIEIGPGEGDYLVELAKRFKQVFAIDNSTSMLNIAKRKTADEQLNNVVFIHGEPLNALKQKASGNLAVCNMVLHHIASPAVIFQHCNQLLQDDGYLLVAELCPHDQEWVRESCGDIWLGFEPDELQHWAEASAFALQQSAYLSLRNGFQVQLHLFQKTSNSNPINFQTFNNE